MKDVPKVHHKKAEIDGVLFSMEITRQLARDRMTVLGWDFHAVEVGNRTEAGGLVVHAFIAGDREYSEMVFHLAEEVIKKRMKEDSKDREFDQVFKRFVNLPEYDRCGVAAYVMGMMKSRMTDDDLKTFSDQVEEMKEVRADFEAEQKSKLDRQHEIIDAAEARSDAEEEVDVSDCCHCEDVQTVQPPLRSSVQSSPDDPYYVCPLCEQKCEIETWKRSELEST